MQDERNTGGWHLDKRVPIALIFAIIFQSITALWWAANIDNRMLTAERQLSEMHPLTSQIPVIQNDIGYIKAGILRIESKLDNHQKDVTSGR